MLRCMCALLWVCTSFEGDVCIPMMCVLGVEGMCVLGVEGDVCAGC